MIGTTLVLSDVKDCPKVRIDIPSLLRVGDRFTARFRLSRRNGGRTDVLLVDEDLRVTEVRLDTSQGFLRQILSVESADGHKLVWRSVRNPAPGRRPRPAISPRTLVE